MKLTLAWRDGEFMKAKEFTDCTQPVEWPSNARSFWVSIYDNDRVIESNLFLSRASYPHGFMWWLGEVRPL